MAGTYARPPRREGTMALSDDLGAEVVKILKEPWTVRDGAKVPDTPDLKLANDALNLEAAVLYADLAESTALVMSHDPKFVASIYKCYLNCACRLIRQVGGEITAFDGDRVMAVFLGSSRATDAVRVALAINHAVTKVIEPRVHEVYPRLGTTFGLRQAVGVDMSRVLVARTGIRGSNDLVWVGRAANLAAKLSAIREGACSTWITDDVLQAADRSVLQGTAGEPLWEARTWTSQSNMRIHRSAFCRPL